MSGAVLRGLVVSIFLVCSVHLAAAAEKIALIVDVSGYSSLAGLVNPHHDGQAISSALQSLGFQVERVSDPKTTELRDVLAKFSDASATSEIAIVYFAGHGAEVEGQNYVLAVDASIDEASDIADQGVPTSAVLHSVSEARQLRIVILDACRNNPFPGVAGISPLKSVPRSDAGSQPISPPRADRGTLIVYSAKDGFPALDGKANENSPFARALLDHLATPGLEVGMLFRRVRDSVVDWTEGRQEPQTYGSLSSMPFFLGVGPEGAAATDRRAAWSASRPDFDRALQTSADEGDLRAMLGLAYIRLSPDDGRFDPDGAVVLLTRAAEAGSAEAVYELGRLYEQGLGVQQDPVKARDLYVQSSDMGFADATNDLGFLYFSGGTSTPRDIEKSLGYFRRASEQKHPQAMFNFAALIDDGLVPGLDADDAGNLLFASLRAGSRDVLDALTNRPEMFKASTLMALQRRLAEEDLYESKIDGKLGQGSIRGIRRAYGIDEN